MLAHSGPQPTQRVCSERAGGNSLLLGSGESRNPAECQNYFFKEAEKYFYIWNNNAEAGKHTEEGRENSSF